MGHLIRVFILLNFPRRLPLLLNPYLNRQSLPKYEHLLNQYQHRQTHLIQIQEVNCIKAQSGLLHPHILKLKRLESNAKFQLNHFQNHLIFKKELERQILPHDEVNPKFFRPQLGRSLSILVCKRLIDHQFQQIFSLITSYELVISLKSLDTNLLHIQESFKLILFQICVPFLVTF